MDNAVVINGKAYAIPKLDFNAICDLADKGFDIMNGTTWKKVNTSHYRAIVAWITGTELEAAGDLFQAHILSGGSVDDVLKAFVDALSESDFFSQATAAMRTAGASGTEKKKKATKTATEE